MELTRGTRVRDRYTLAEFQGSGNFGEVWLAHDEMLDSDVALKIYMSLDPAGVEEFRSEYRVTQGVHHPHLLTPAYFDIWERRPFLVMKYCAAGSSSKLAGKTDEYTLWQFIHDVAAGLAYLHSLPEPIIHQDIKPDNILVDGNGRFLITDFGISKRLRATMRKQSQRAVGAGATAYMGPERFGSSDSAPVKASDIWSLGASIYELAMGELPFSGFGGGMQRNGAETPILDERWSKEMNMVMQSCLAKETWERPTAAQLETYAAAILANEPAEVTWTPPSSYAGTPPDDGGDPPSRFPWKTVLTVLLLLLVIFGIVMCCWYINRPPKKVVPPAPSVIPAPSKAEEHLDSLQQAPVVEKDRKTPSNMEEVVVEVAEDSASPYVSATPAPAPPQKVETKVETKKDSDAERLKQALANGDYQQVRQLADKGYAAAYGPLAKHYLQTAKQPADYDRAHNYAQRAQDAGYSEGTEVLDMLNKLGY